VGIISLSLFFGAALSWNMANAITVETRRANQELAASELKYHTLADNTSDWEFWIGPNGEAIYNSPSCKRTIGYTADELAADLSLFAGIIHPDDRHRFSAHRHTASQDQKEDELEVRIIRKDGEVCWLSHRCRPVFSERGEYLGTRGANTDITRRKQAEEEIKQLAFYDPLTGLPNRRLMMDRLQHAETASMRSGRHGALLFIDLDNFKTLNDTLGHDVGDLLLQQVAQRLVASVRESDTVARLGGDEFVLILEDLSRDSQEAHSQVSTVGEKILGSLNATYQLARYEYHNTPSIGATLFIGHEHSVSELLKRADIAMYQAKKAGRNTLRFFGLETEALTHPDSLVS
jgi:diguanylate cyclase (GGDEF)-like protein/PAS domain S-box-containing protein